MPDTDTTTTHEPSRTYTECLVLANATRSLGMLMWLGDVG